MRLDEPLSTVTLTISRVADASPPTSVSVESTTRVTTVPMDRIPCRADASACMASALDASIVSSIGCCDSRWRDAEYRLSSVVLTVA